MGTILGLISLVFIARQALAWPDSIAHPNSLRGLESRFPARDSGERGWAHALGFLRVRGKIVDDVVTTYSAAVTATQHP